MSYSSASLESRINDQEHEAFSNIGLELYIDKLKSVLEPEMNNQFVAIHVDSEQYALGVSSGDAMRAMRKIQPKGRLVILRIGPEPEWGLAARLLAGQMAAGQPK
jgi:hypothetical protein